MVRVEIGTALEDGSTAWLEDLTERVPLGDLEYAMRALLERARKRDLEVTGFRTTRESA